MTEPAQDAATQQPAALPVDQVGDAVLSGGARLSADARVPVVTESGAIETVAASDLKSALDYGWRIARSDEVQAFREREKYGTGLASAQAAGEAALRGMTVGLSDKALTELGVDAEGLRKRRELNPGLSVGFELGGALAPLVLSGGTSATAQGAGLAARGAAAGSTAVRALGAPVRAVAGAGRAVNAGARGLLGEGVLARGAAGALSGAVEGGLVGLGHAVSESAIQDIPLTTERAMASVGTGALWGGAAGGAFGTIGASLEKQVLPKLKEALTVEKIQGLVDRAGLRQWAQGRGKGAFKQLRREFGDEAEAVMGRTVREEGLDRLIADGATWDEIHKLTAERLGVQGRRIGDALGKVDDAFPGTAPQASASIAKRARKEILAPLRKSGIKSDSRLATKIEEDFEFLFPKADMGAKDIGGQLVARRQELAPTFRRLHELRRRVDDLAGWKSPDPNPTQQQMRKLRGIIEDEIDNHAGKVAAEAGGTVAEGYQAAKGRYKALKWLNDVAEDNAASELRNRTVSLTDTIAGSAITAGMLTRLAAGDMSALGSIVLATMSGAAATAANKILREQGQGMAARVGQKTLDIMRASEQTAKRTDRAIGKFFQKPKSGTVAPLISAEVGGGMMLAERFEKERKDFEAFAQAPESKLMRSLGDTDTSAPAVAQQAREVSARGAAFLQEKMPRTRDRASDPHRHLRPEATRRSHSEMAKWLRYADAVKNPGKVIDRIGDGTVTREHAEALRAVYPRMFQQVAEQIERSLVDAKEPLEHRRLVRLSLLLGRPLHYTMEPGFIRMTQGVFAAQREQAKGGLTPGQRRPPELASREKTASQQLETL